MTSKEMRLSRKEAINQKLAQIFERVLINEIPCFLLKDGSVCRLDSIGSEIDAIVIEYADNMDMAKKNLFGEDGDLFYMSELNEDEMFNAIIEEIEC